MKALLLGLLVAAACGGNDDCKKLLHNLGEDPSELAMKTCEEHIAELRKEPTTKCIIDAANKDEAQKCIQKDLDKVKDSADRAQKAVDQANQAVKAADEAQKKLDDLGKQLDDLNAQVNTAVDQVAAAQNDADRQAAKAKLEQLQKTKQDLLSAVANAKSDAAKTERQKGVHISKECMDNPLAKGCS